jgi:uncharacterized protein DUF3891
VIVRGEGDRLLLITQPDHARLAEQLLASVRTEPVLLGDSRGIILLATREHDNGWAEVDADPTIDPDTGRPRDFMTGPTAVKHELWVRGITRVAQMDARAGALVAEHALTVYAYREAVPEWQSFFDAIRVLRDELLRAIGAFAGAPRVAFEQQYRCVQLADAFSLQFCNGWPDPHPILDYSAVMRDGTLLIAPDPFAGAAIPLRVLGRHIPARRYQDDADLRDAIAATAPEVIVGAARGGG